MSLLSLIADHDEAAPIDRAPLSRTFHQFQRGLPHGLRRRRRRCRFRTLEPVLVPLMKFDHEGRGAGRFDFPLTDDGGWTTGDEERPGQPDYAFAIADAPARRPPAG